MHGNKADEGDDAEDIPRRLTAKVAGPAIAAAAISLGLVLIGACGLGHHDVYVAPPPINADGNVATGTRAASATSFVVVIPPSPSWHIAVRRPPRDNSTDTPFPSYPGDTPTDTDPYTTDPFDEPTTDPFDEPTTDPNTTDPYATDPYAPPTSSTDPFDNDDDTTTTSPTTTVTTDPQDPYHRLPPQDGN